MAFDASRQRLVLFGGSAGLVSRGDTWEWDGATWTERSPVRSPPGSSYPELVYDDARRRVLLFDGDTWVFLP